MAAAVALFTRDLRVRDNPVLDATTTGGGSVAPLFVFDRSMLERTAHGAPHRLGFLCQSLLDLDNSLRERGGLLVVRRGDWLQEVLQVVYESRAKSVHVARDASSYAQRRLAQLERAAARVGVQVVVHDALTIVAPDGLGKPYESFAWYAKRWRAGPRRALARTPRKFQVPGAIATDPIPDLSPPGEWVGGETAALAQLKAWIPKLRFYEEERENLAADATSRLSAALHFGCLSALDLERRVHQRDRAERFLHQLCRRDFFTQLLWWRPELARTDLHEGSRRRWRDSPGALAAWKEGRTGFPLVDAGMRQLRADGWMPDPVRVIAASFLTDALGIDWRVGAAHFMQLLVDGDIATNQLNWQWIARKGAGPGSNRDRPPNPATQLDRYDPNCEYVRRWVEELDTARYPPPIIDHNGPVGQWRATKHHA